MVNKLILLILTLVSFPISAAAVTTAISAITVAGWIQISIAVVSFSFAAYVAYQTKKMSQNMSQQEIKQLLRGERTPKQVIYGQAYASGALIFAEEEIGDTEQDNGTAEEILTMVVGVAGHEIEELIRVDLNEEEISTFVNQDNKPRAGYKLHNNPQVLDDDVLLDGAPSWKEDMIGKGTCWVRLTLFFDRELFSGIPTPRFLIKGKKVWDMRTDEVIYSDNAALVIADFLITYLGFTRDRIKVDGFGSFIDAANLCDELVSDADGNQSKRYTINGHIMMNEKPNDVINDMLASCLGSLIRESDKIGLLPAAYYGFSPYTIYQDDVISDISLQPQVSYSDAINTIKGTFVDPEQDYVETDFPPIVDEEALARDGQEIVSDVSFRFVTNVYQAQRVAAIMLKRANTGGRITCTTNFKGLYAQIGGLINVDIKEMALIGEYRVESFSLSIQNGVDLTLVRDDISIYDDSIGKPYTPPPLTNLPTQRLTEPSTINFIIETIGETVQGFITWTINDPRTAYSDIRFKKQSTGEIILVGQSNNNRFRVNSLLSDDYNVEVRSVDLKGNVSGWAVSSFTVELPPKPTTITVNRSNWNIELIPNIDGGTPSGTIFEFAILADDNSYILDPPSFNENDFLQSKVVATGSSYNCGGLTPDRWYHFWIKSINVYGSSESTYIQTGTTKDGDLIVTVVEKLVAVTIESANYSYDQKTGYKLYSPADDPITLPDGEVLDNPDGLAVFSKMVLHDKLLVGDIPNKLGFLVNGDGTIKSANYQENVEGYILSKDGKITAIDGYFGGLVEADKIIGDVAAIKRIVTPIIETDYTRTYCAFNVLPYDKFDRTIEFKLFVSTNAGQIVTSIRTYAFGSLVSESRRFVSNANNLEEGFVYFSVAVPKNTGGEIFAQIYVYSASDTGTVTVSGGIDEGEGYFNVVIFKETDQIYQ